MLNTKFYLIIALALILISNSIWCQASDKVKIEEFKIRKAYFKASNNLEEARKESKKIEKLKSLLKSLNSNSSNEATKSSQVQYILPTETHTVKVQKGSEKTPLAIPENDKDFETQIDNTIEELFKKYLKK